MCWELFCRHATNGERDKKRELERFRERWSAFLDNDDTDFCLRLLDVPYGERQEVPLANEQLLFINREYVLSRFDNPTAIVGTKFRKFVQGLQTMGAHLQRIPDETAQIIIHEISPEISHRLSAVQVDGWARAVFCKFSEETGRHMAIAFVDRL